MPVVPERTKAAAVPATPADGYPTYRIAQFFFIYFSFVGIFAPFFGLYLQGQGLLAWQIGVLVALAQVLRIFGPNLWGWWADHTQQPVHIMRSLAVLAWLSFVGLLWHPGFSGLFCILILANLFLSGQVPLSEALTAQQLRGDFARYGRLRAWGSLGFIVAVVGAGYWLEWVGIALLPWLMLGVLAALVFATQRLPEASLPAPEVAHHDPLRVSSYRGLLRRPEVLCFLLSCGFMIAAHMALYTYFSIYLSMLGYEKQAIGWLWGLSVLSEIVVFYFQSVLFRRLTAFSLLVLSFCLCALRFALIAGWAQILWVLLLAQLLHAFTFGVHHSATLAYLQQWFARDAQARGQALYTSVGYGVGGSLGGLLCASLWQPIGPAGVFMLSALLAVCALLSLLVSRWLQRRLLD